MEISNICSELTVCHAAIALFICAAVVLCCKIITGSICRIHTVKKEEAEKRIEFEETKLNNESADKKEKDWYDAAWRTIQKSWDKENKVDADQLKMAERFIMNCWEKGIGESRDTSGEMNKAG